MNLTKVTKANQIQLAGINVELNIVDGTVKGATLTDHSGGTLVIQENSYSVDLLVPARPKLEKAKELVGEVIGVPVREYFTQRQTSRANKRVDQIVEAGGKAELKDVELTEEKVAELEAKYEIPF